MVYLKDCFTVIPAFSSNTGRIDDRDPKASRLRLTAALKIAQAALPHFTITPCAIKDKCIKETTGEPSVLLH